MLQYWFLQKSISSIYEYCFLMSDKYVFFILDIDFLLLAFNKRSSSSLQNFRHVAVHGTTYLIDLLFSNFLCHVLVTIWKFLVSWIREPKDFVQTGYFQMLIHWCFFVCCHWLCSFSIMQALPSKLAICMFFAQQ